MPDRSQNHQILAQLRGQLDQLNDSTHRLDGQSETVISSGCPDLDHILPQGGFRPGQLIEWLSAYPGSGAFSWALQSCRMQTTGDQSEKKQSIVIIDLDHTFYPPAAGGLGIDLERLVVVRPKNATDAMWALDQALRCPAVVATCATLPRLAPRDFRRLQLAAEQGNTLGHLLRPLSVRGQPSWSDLQLRVQPRGTPGTTDPNIGPPISTARKSTARKQSRHQALRTWHLELLRCRGGRAGATVEVTGSIATGDWLSSSDPACSSVSHVTPSPSSCHEQSNTQKPSNALHLAAELARPTTARRASRA